jgi:hypothetical protein
VLDKLLSKEQGYQTVDKGIIAYLLEKNKRYWPIFPLQIGKYSLLNKQHAEKEAKTLGEIFLCAGNKKVHDPQNAIYEHIRVFKLAQKLFNRLIMQRISSEEPCI